MSEKPVLAVIGGSGVYNMSALQNAESIEMDTPFGKPSSPVIVGTIEGKRVAFLARHGIGHTISPSEINYRANIYALKALNVPRVISISACGSLREDYAPGHIVIPDQLVDFTRGQRKNSFFENGLVAHIGTADPYCAILSGQAYAAVKDSGAIVHKGGAFITIEGPRFSTRAESNLFRSWGMSIIGMTAAPEAFLAREAEMCYSTMAHVTDYDVWHISEDPVSVEMVVQTLIKNTEYAQQSIINLVKNLQEDHACDSLLSDALITNLNHIPAGTRKKLSLLTQKYIG